MTTHLGLAFKRLRDFVDNVQGDEGDKILVRREINAVEQAAYEEIRFLREKVAALELAQANAIPAERVTSAMERMDERAEIEEDETRWADEADLKQTQDDASGRW